MIDVVGFELEAKLKYFAEQDTDECDAMLELLKAGFTLEDFKYNEERYEWAKRVMNDYGLI